MFMSKRMGAEFVGERGALHSTPHAPRAIAMRRSFFAP
jgi:hypothetical protein